MTPEEFFNLVRDSIHSDFHCQKHGGLVTHNEVHHDGTTSKFSLRLSCKAEAFSLDKPGKDPFPIVVPGMNSRNDLTVVCLDSKGQPLVFVVECKNSGSPNNAQHQIECGMAFCEYLFKLLSVCHGKHIVPKLFGVAAYNPKSPPKGTTRPRFVSQGKLGILRAEWSIALELPLRELVQAAESSYA